MILHLSRRIYYEETMGHQSAVSPLLQHAVIIPGLDSLHSLGDKNDDISICYMFCKRFWREPRGQIGRLKCKNREAITKKNGSGKLYQRLRPNGEG